MTTSIPEKGIDIEDAKKSSNFQSFMNSVKLFLGNVYLTIPNVFSKTGWLGGIMLYSIVALLNSYTMTQILKVTETYSLRRDPETAQ